MLDKIGQTRNMRQVAGTIPIHHRYTVGLAGERFFRALRDESRILASPCARCEVALLPPKIYCERCFQETGEDWLEVSGPGVLRSFTVMHRDLDEQPLDEPQAVGLIEWPGIRGGLLHRLDGAHPSALRIGMAVEPVWANERTGALADISHFRPVAE